MHTFVCTINQCIFCASVDSWTLAAGRRPHAQREPAPRRRERRLRAAMRQATNEVELQQVAALRGQNTGTTESHGRRRPVDLDVLPRGGACGGKQVAEHRRPTVSRCSWLQMVNDGDQVPRFVLEFPVPQMDKQLVESAESRTDVFFLRVTVSHDASHRARELVQCCSCRRLFAKAVGSWGAVPFCD